MKVLDDRNSVEEFGFASEEAGDEGAVEGHEKKKRIGSVEGHSCCRG